MQEDDQLVNCRKLWCFDFFRDPFWVCFRRVHSGQIRDTVLFYNLTISTGNYILVEHVIDCWCGETWRLSVGVCNISSCTQMNNTRTCCFLQSVRTLLVLLLMSASLTAQQQETHPQFEVQSVSTHQIFVELSVFVRAADLSRTVSQRV